VDSQASAVSLHVLTTSSPLSPLVTASSVSALSPTGKLSNFAARLASGHWQSVSHCTELTVKQMTVWMYVSHVLMFIVFILCCLFCV